jgi:putative ABC transport system substrate-binding protein
MDRRAFIAGVTGVIVAPLVGEAQPVGKVPRIGFLQRAQNENVGVFIQALRDAGYVDGQNAVLDTRIYEGSLERLPQLANELVALKCDVLLIRLTPKHTARGRKWADAPWPARGAFGRRPWGRAVG